MNCICYCIELVCRLESAEWWMQHQDTTWPVEHQRRNQTETAVSRHARVLEAERWLIKCKQSSIYCVIHTSKRLLGGTRDSSVMCSCDSRPLRGIRYLSRIFYTHCSNTYLFCPYCNDTMMRFTLMTFMSLPTHSGSCWWTNPYPLP